MNDEMCLKRQKAAEGCVWYRNKREWLNAAHSCTESLSPFVTNNVTRHTTKFTRKNFSYVTLHFIRVAFLGYTDDDDFTGHNPHNILVDTLSQLIVKNHIAKFIDLLDVNVKLVLPLLWDLESG
jgi:hypothetical protein